MSSNNSSANEVLASRSSRSTWTIILWAGLAAGFVSFAIGEAAPSMTPPDLDLPAEIRADRNQVPIETERRMRRAKDLSAAIAFGSLGMLLGLALGAAAGLARSSTRGALAAGLAGLVVGGSAGAGVTLLVLPWYHAARAAATDDNANMDVALALATHCCIWSAVGAAAGLALGAGLGGGSRIARAMIGGILGAALAAVAYEFTGAIAFSTAETFRPVAAAWPPRLMAHLVVALFTSAGALWAARNLRLRRARPPSPS
jgi:hypothetical protein